MRKKRVVQPDTFCHLVSRVAHRAYFLSKGRCEMKKLSMMIGVGGNTLFAIRLGERKYQQAAIILNNSFVLLIIMAVSSFTLGQIFMVPLLKLFGASDQLLPVASSYMRIILCGAIFQTIVPGMNHFIRSMGHPKTAMTRVMIGAGSNVILDWLFIMKLNWGIEGAAWATVLSQFIGGLAVMQFFVKKTTPIKVNRRYMKPLLCQGYTVTSCTGSDFKDAWI